MARDILDYVSFDRRTRLLGYCKSSRLSGIKRRTHPADKGFKDAGGTVRSGSRDHVDARPQYPLYLYRAICCPSWTEQSRRSCIARFGITALAGIGVTGKLVDRALRKTVLASLLVFAMIALAFALLPASPTLVFTGVAIWGLTFGGAATLLQTALADTAGDGADVALSMNVVAWNSAVAGGGIVGGILLNTYGVSSFSWAVVLLLIVGLILAWRARSRDFRRPQIIQRPNRWTLKFRREILISRPSIT